MRPVAPKRPKINRIALRYHTPSYLQMHVYEQELQRLKAERAVIAERVNVIAERVKVVQSELQKLERVFKKSVPHTFE